ncbi:MAG: thiamine phosphate synthase [Proteobacteria bacterium]|nr:MAG: thiamine phosphate synthase [Pseudomonadota bacterium]
MNTIMNSVPAVWSIAGHDPFSGAGISADLRVAAALWQPLRTIIASFTAQNDQTFFAAEANSVHWLDQQWKALASAETPAAYKVGLLLNPESVRFIADHVKPGIPLILDPVLGSSSGRSFVSSDLLSSMRDYLFRATSLLTPNRPEAEIISGIKIDSEDDLKTAAAIIRSQGVAAVLIKGGHAEGDTLVDYFDDGKKPFFLSTKRLPGSFRGTGCALSTAIASYIAKGEELRDAVVAGHSYVQTAIAISFREGSNHLLSFGQTPHLSDLYYSAKPEGKFAPMPRAIGFYPVLPNVEWIERFAKSGVQTVQLRVKGESEATLRQSILRAKEVCEANDILLFVNDAWQLAIEYGAFGVHLGQEDLDLLNEDDLKKIRDSGLRLGISTHSLEESARAKTLGPSYIALGPVFETTCKSMRFGPQGIARVGEWVKRLPQIPIVAIGGLKLDHAPEVLAEGADSIAVISNLTEAPEPEQRMNDWLKVFSR